MHSLKDWQPLTFIGSAYILKWGDLVEGRGEEDKESVGDKGNRWEDKHTRPLPPWIKKKVA